MKIYTQFDYIIKNDYKEETMGNILDNVIKETSRNKGMNVKVLGTQSPYVTDNHNCPGFLIVNGSTKIMLDCGSGSHRLLSFPNDLGNLSVIISHLHRDHYNDIYNLQYSSLVFHNQERLQKPIDIYLPKTPENIYEDITTEKLSFSKCASYDENTKLRIGDIDISFCRTDHPVETYAIKASNGKKTIVYTADTSFASKDKLADFAQNVDLLISEASLLEKHGFPEINTHLTAKQAGIIAKEANVKCLMLTHFWPEEPVINSINEAKTVFPYTIAANEGMIIELENEKEIEEDMR